VNDQKRLHKRNSGNSGTVRIPAEMLRAIEDFLKTDFAKSRGFRFKSDVVTQAVRNLLDKYGAK